MSSERSILDETDSEEEDQTELPKEGAETSAYVKIILLGDSMVGKSRLVERFLMDNYEPRNDSTYGLMLFRYDYKSNDGKTYPIDFWDTAGLKPFHRYI